MNSYGPTETEEPAAPQPPPPPRTPDWKAGFDNLGQLRRSSTDRKLAGVCGGIARHFGIDATLVRVIFVLLIFFGGGSLLAYLLIWLVTPADTNQSDPWGNTLRAWAVAGAGIFALCLLVVGGFEASDSLWALIPIGILTLIGLGIYSVWPKSGVTTTTTPAQQYPVAGGIPPQPVAPVRPPAPKPTGLILFWPTLALIAIAVGILGIYDTSHEVNPISYLALSLAIIGAMTMLGSVTGRPGGLVPVGILVTLALGAISAFHAVFGFATPEFNDRNLLIENTNQLDTNYNEGAGSFSMDLTQISDPEALAGRTINVRMRAGAIAIYLPPNQQVRVNATVHRFGAIDIYSDNPDLPPVADSRAGLRPSIHYLSPNADPNKALTLNLSTNFGAINVNH